MSDPVHSARAGAIDLLGAVLGDRQMLLDSLDRLQSLAPEDRARAQRLATETLRALPHADALLTPHMRRAPTLYVHNVLRLGAVELSTGGAAHGVVNDLVSLVGRHRKHKTLKGLVNAVLRKVAAEGPARWPDLAAPRLPGPLRKRLTKAWGGAAIAQMEKVFAMRPPVDLTPKTASILPDGLDGGYTPTGSFRLAAPGQISSLPGYSDGAWWVQDAAAAIPVRVLDPQPGESVLDLCAAPGGKTLQLAAAGAAVTALDLSEARLERLRENLERCGLSAHVVTGDALRHAGTYSAVLLDAPCSATGTLRRHPDLPHVKDLRDLDTLIALQARMIDHAWTLLQPGGRLVFCTCSLLPQEGEAHLDAALDRLPGAVVDTDALARPGIDPAWVTPRGGLRLRPDYWADQGGMDGFFIACLVKQVEAAV